MDSPALRKSVMLSLLQIDLSVLKLQASIHIHAHDFNFIHTMNLVRLLWKEAVPGICQPLRKAVKTLLKNLSSRLEPRTFHYEKAQLRPKDRHSLALDYAATGISYSYEMYPY